MKNWTAVSEEMRRVNAEAVDVVAGRAAARAAEASVSLDGDTVAICSVCETPINGGRGVFPKEGGGFCASDAPKKRG